MTKEELEKWCKENGVKVINDSSADNLRRRKFEHLFQEAMYDQPALPDQRCPEDPTKSICYVCKKAFPTDTMIWAEKDEEIVSVDRTVINGLITRDFNHYRKINVLVCKECAKEVNIEDYIFLFFKYGIFVYAGLVLLYFIISGIIGELLFSDTFRIILGSIGLLWGIISAFIFNERRFSISK